jgi:hypothetical protein
MLNYQGIARYRQLVTSGNYFGNRYIHGDFVTDSVTRSYRSLVTLKGLSIKAFDMLLPMLPKNYTYIAYIFLSGALWA